MLKTSSGRIVKKVDGVASLCIIRIVYFSNWCKIFQVVYADESFEEIRRTVRRKNLVDGESDEGGSTSESEYSYTKRKRFSKLIKNLWFFGLL